MKNVKLRAKSAAILFAIIIPFFFITYFAKVPGKVIGLAFFMFFAAWATYEVISHNKLSRWMNILIVFSTVIIWAFPLDFYVAETAGIKNQFWNTQQTGIDIYTLTKMITNVMYFGIDRITHFRALGLSIIFILITLVFLINCRIYKTAKSLFINYFISLFALIFIPAFLKIMFMFNVGNIYFIFCIFFIPIVVDTTAYFAGRLLGHKIFKIGLAPHISPKKTWEGAIIAYLFGALFVFITMYLGKLTNNIKFTLLFNWKQLIAAVLILPAISQIGDLWFSGIKRLYDIKDFSDLIPGHGGLMDRFDSVSFVAVTTSMILLIK
ncbi:phosphatidate cytidylyltransferase [Metamycoplasma neophronis]|uniref:Phosphatidate cytidylyltransferase n=1 Tax=Metamycoplasma neophronis TaxID=872983 RepID=A0ABY2Z2Y5_9BACT|nr:phosphatidate cytidylyltransferase [Metamycoplasma neophronis]TPR54746.1 phosphatidate cytidylyltransferase [Metamycoplasma neophronis]